MKKNNIVSSPRRVRSKTSQARSELVVKVTRRKKKVACKVTVGLDLGGPEQPLL